MTPAALQTKLLAAIVRGDRRQIDACLAAGATLHDSPDAGLTTPFTFAVKRGDVALIAYLLDRGADPNHQQLRGVTPPPLAIAVLCDLRAGTTARTALLLARGGHPDIKFTYNKKPQQTIIDMLDDVMPFAIAPEDVAIEQFKDMLQQAREMASEETRLRMVQMQKRQRNNSKSFKL